MEIAVVQLSDIHINSGTEPVLARASKLRNAVHASTPNAEACVLVLSGDIACSGAASQYDAVGAMLAQLKLELLKLPHLQRVEVISVPGNHDCDFTDESDIRDFLLSDTTALYKSDIDLTGDKAKALLSVQANFFQFEATVGGYKELAAADRIAWARSLEFGNFSIRFQCFNTAWLSRRRETQSKLFMPPKALEPYPGEASLSVSVFHHPYNWLDANNYRQFKDLVEKTSDFVFTGHEHVSSVSGIDRITGEHLHYVEGAALNGEGGQLDSAFNIVSLNFATGEQKIDLYKWNGEYYGAASTSAWTPLVTNPSRERQLLRVNRSFLQTLNDTGTNFTHRRSRHLTLQEIFVYPRMRRWSPETQISGQKRSTNIPSRTVVQHFRETTLSLVSGPDDSGKTSLLKKLYQDLAGEFAPLLIDASKLEGRISEARFLSLIKASVEQQYDSHSVERFLQLEPSRKLLLIDDFHKSNLSAQNEGKFLRQAEAMFGHIIVTVSDLYRMREMARLGTSFDPFRLYERCDLLEFGHVLRAALIRNWLSIGRNTAEEINSLDHDVAATEKTLTSLLGKNVVPAFPFSVLTIVQMLESAQPHSTMGTSYGHLYEALIKATLSHDSAEGMQDAEEHFTYVSLVAYSMFTRNSALLTEKDLREVAGEYARVFQVNVDFQRMLKALIRVKILDCVDGNYFFRYRHIYYYFVAKYFDRALRRRDARSVDLRASLIYCADRLHNEEFANIVLFYVHMSQDWDLVLHILGNAKCVYADKPACDFELDVEFVNKLYKEASKPLLVDTTDIDRNRDEYRERMDEAEEEERPPLSLDAKVTYSDDLSDIHKANIAFKTLQVLGQMLQSASATLEGDQKVQIVEACYALGLRALKAILALAETDIDGLRIYLASLITERAALQNHPLTNNELLRRTDEALIAFTLGCAYGTLKKISFAVGSQRFEETYGSIRKRTGECLSLDLIDLLIKLDHFGIVPEYEINRARDKVVKNTFGYTILRQMITDFLYLYRVDIRTAQKLGALFSIKSTVPEMLLPDFKKD